MLELIHKCDDYNMAAFDFTDLYNALSIIDRQKKALLEQKKAEIAAHRAKLLELASNGGCRMTRAMKAEYDLIQKADRTLDDILNQLDGLSLS
jgi:hypothetical protein